MKGEHQLLRLGEYLVGRACQRLPQDIREERYAEWAAELPAILHDPQIRLAPRRAVRMLGYAADTLRAAAVTPARAPRRTPRAAAALSLLLLADLALLAWDIWATMRAPAYGLNYLQLAGAVLLVAFPISLFVRSTARVTALIVLGGGLAGVAISLWNTAQAPGDWVNYFIAAWLLLLLLTWWLASRWARSGHAGSPGSRRVTD